MLASNTIRLIFTSKYKYIQDILEKKTSKDTTNQA